MRLKGNVRQSFGIGEWYGRILARIGHEAARELTAASNVPCPFQHGAVCRKQGGVCSLQCYELTDDVAVPAGPLVTTCPNRFAQGNEVYKWVAQVIMETPTPILLGEINFLRGVVHGEAEEEGSREDVGRIDNVLVHPELDPLRWCALEMQAVYFSGGAMRADFARASNHDGPWPPFPSARRRPDYRSSGPKRLMPQLQIKVPTLRRWGKKMAVVVDQAFFAALAPMTAVSDISNADIVWFVVQYETEGDHAVLSRGMTCATTLEHAVEGLTAGQPVSLRVFEEQLLRKARRLEPLD